MQALGRYIIVEKVKSAPRKVGGLELTEKQDKENRYVEGIVISVGEEVDKLKAGDRITYDKVAGHERPDGDKSYQVIRYENAVDKL